MNSARQIIVYFDPARDGHHAEYLAFFLAVCESLNLTVAAWVPQQVWDGAVGIMRAPAEAGFLARAADVTEGGIWQRLQLIDEMFSYVEHNKVAAVFFGMLDGLIMPLALRRLAGRKSPVPWTGILMIDDFHFPNVPNGWKARVKMPFKVSGLRFALRDGAVSLLMSNPVWPTKLPVPAIWLPDTLSSLDLAAQRAVEASGVWPVRQEPPKQNPGLRLVSFGIITPRKGLVEFCEGLALLSDDELAHIEFKIMGKMSHNGSPDYVVRLREVVAALQRRGMPIDLHEAYVPEQLIGEAVRWCDVVVAPYINHNGSSGLINIAAQYGRPVITQASSQVGYEARTFDLGVCVDCRDANATAAVVRRFLTTPFEPTEGMRTFCRTRSPRQAFAVSADAIAKAVGIGEDAATGSIEAARSIFGQSAAP